MFVGIFGTLYAEGGAVNLISPEVCFAECGNFLKLCGV